MSSQPCRYYRLLTTMKRAISSFQRSIHHFNSEKEIHAMRNITTHIVNAFTDNKQGGNPAAVVLNADDLSTRAKQAIAAEMALSETAFVSKSKVGDFKVEFFTPNQQIPHCGHATVATFTLLDKLGHLNKAEIQKESIEGLRTVRLKNGRVHLEQLPPVFKSVNAEVKDEILESIGLKHHHLASLYPIEVVSTGVPFVQIPVTSRKVLRELTPDFPAIKASAEKAGGIGYYVFTLDTKLSNNQANARMFAPSHGIEEESATGMAAGALSTYLKKHAYPESLNFRIEQGHFMKPASPSLINAEIEQNAENDISAVWVSGYGEVIDRKKLVLEN